MTSTTPASSPAVPGPSDWPQLRAAIEQARGRPLLLAAADLPSECTSLWVATSNVDLIVYPRGAEPTEQLRAIAHQAAHIFLGHQAAATDTDPSLFPHLAPEFVAATTTIASFSECDELAADSFAARVVESEGLPEIAARPNHDRHRTPGGPA